MPLLQRGGDRLRIDSPSLRHEKPAWRPSYRKGTCLLSLAKPLLATLALVLLAGCAEINKPITPNDPWRERATSDLNGLPR